MTSTLSMVTRNYLLASFAYHAPSPDLSPNPSQKPQSVTDVQGNASDGTQPISKFTATPTRLFFSSFARAVTSSSLRALPCASVCQPLFKTQSYQSFMDEKPLFQFCESRQFILTSFHVLLSAIHFSKISLYAQFMDEKLLGILHVRVRRQAS